MSKKINEKFLKVYAEVEKVCCEKFGANEGGIEAYINRLNNARFAPGRDEVLERLANYKNLFGSFQFDANDAKSAKNAAAYLRKSNDVTKDDIKWLEGFSKQLAKKKDPISEYLRKARNFARRRKARNVIVTILVIAVIAVAAYFGYTMLMV